MTANESAAHGRAEEGPSLLQVAAFMQAAGFPAALERELLSILSTSHEVDAGGVLAPPLLVMRALREVEQRARTAANLAEGVAVAGVEGLARTHVRRVATSARRNRAVAAYSLANHPALQR